MRYWREVEVEDDEGWKWSNRSFRVRGATESAVALVGEDGLDWRSEVGGADPLHRSDLHLPPHRHSGR